jgi:lipoprotein signal peptidase
MVLGLVAASLAAIDLAHKALADGVVVYHHRPASHMLVLGVAAIGWAAAVTMIRSTGLAAAGGVLAGGVAANVVSGLVWPGVPDPLMFGRIAYNLADVFVVGGFALTLVAATVFAVRNRERLGDPVRP